ATTAAPRSTSPPTPAARTPCGSCSNAEPTSKAHDSTWDSTPLEWAKVGSGERPMTTATPDWAETVRVLLDAGASLDGTTLSLDDPKAPSPEVAELLRASGVASINA